MLVQHMHARSDHLSSLTSPCLPIPTYCGRSVQHLGVVMALACTALAASEPELVVCDGMQSASTQTWTVVASGGVITSGDGHCVNVDASTKGKSGAGFCDPNGHGCLGLGACAGAPQWKVVPRSGAEAGTADIMLVDGSACIDWFGGTKIIQAYNCVKSPNQGWRINATAKTIQAVSASQSAPLENIYRFCSARSFDHLN
jgi:hypothetical protein